MRVPISLPVRFACLLLLTTSCSLERPVAPDDDMAVSAALLDAPPSSLSAWTQSDVAIQLYWQDNSSHESGYELHRATGSTGAFDHVVRLAANASSHLDGNLTPLTEYCYKVRAFRTRGNRTTYSDFSSTACAKTLGPPAAPSGAKALPGLYGGIEVLWTDNSTIEEGFRVRRTTSAGTTETTVSANTTSFVDWNVQVEQETCYQVTAYNRYGESDPSNSDCIGLPAAPTNLRQAGVTSTTIDLAWDDVSTFEDGFEIQAMRCYWSYPYYDYYGWGEPQWVCELSHVEGTVGANVSAYRVTGLFPSTTYYYQVVAFREKEARRWSSGANGIVEVTTDP